MDEYLITKKELLSTAGISYGSLYRWKRKKLIPDEWFIHRATFTGQETFFPRDKILERINKILELKETMSLDVIAETLDPNLKSVSLGLEHIANLGIASPFVIDIYLAKYGEFDEYDNHRLLSIYLCSRLLALGTLGRDDIFPAVDLFEHLGKKTTDLKIVFARKLGVCICVAASEQASLVFDNEITVIAEISISQLQSDLSEMLRKENN